MQEEILDLLKIQIDNVISNYGIAIALLIIGFIVGFYFKEYVSDRHFRNQIELRFKEKDDHINSLKLIVHDRVSKIEVEKKDKNFISRIKKYFKEKM